MKQYMSDIVDREEEAFDPFTDRRRRRRRRIIADKEEEYRQKIRRMLGGETSIVFGTLKEMMQQVILKDEEQKKRLTEKAKDGTLKANGELKPASQKERPLGPNDTPVQKKLSGASATPTSWDNADVTPATIRWDEMPSHDKGAETPGAKSKL